MAYWWVNQNQTFEHELAGKFLWAPYVSAAGQTLGHWDNMERLRRGDVVFNFSSQHVQAVSSVVVPARPAAMPSTFPEATWNSEGRLVRLETRKLPVPLHRKAIPEEMRLGEDPFQVTGNAKVGYLWEVSDELGTWLIQEIGPPPSAVELPVEEGQDVAADLTANPRRPMNAGFIKDSYLKRQIETYAVDRASQFLTTRGWSVEDVGATHAFDLLCTRDGEELHVEVKGTTTDGEKVSLTAGEVRHNASYPNCALFVVRGITAKPAGEKKWDLSGGVDHLRMPWKIEEADLEAVSYRYTVGLGSGDIA